MLQEYGENFLDDLSEEKRELFRQRKLALLHPSSRDIRLSRNDREWLQDDELDFSIELQKSKDMYIDLYELLELWCKQSKSENISDRIMYSKCIVRFGILFLKESERLNDVIDEINPCENELQSVILKRIKQYVSERIKEPNLKKLDEIENLIITEGFDTDEFGNDLEYKNMIVLLDECIPKKEFAENEFHSVFHCSLFRELMNSEYINHKTKQNDYRIRIDLEYIYIKLYLQNQL